MNNMNDINRRKINDIIVPDRGLIKRPVISPSNTITNSNANGDGNNTVPPRVIETDRIGRNPFFEKNRPVQSISTPQKKTQKSRGAFISLFFLLLLIVGFFVANYFTKATIDVIPVQKSVTIENNFVANKSGLNEGLEFQFMNLEVVKSKEVVSTVEQMVQKKSSGKVVVFNGYSSTPQRLIKNTRLETPDRKIFRINDSVVVPGMTMVNGKTVPGSVEVTVFADAPGKEYNLGTTNFTVPGFKGDPRYSQFYAVSKTDSPLSGGYSGTIKVPSEESISLAYTEVKNILKKDVIEKARAQIPPQMTAFPGSMIIKFEEVPSDFSSPESLAKVSVKATVSVFFFETTALNEAISKVSLPGEKGNRFSITEISSLDFTFVEPVEKVVLQDLERINFRLNGNVHFVGQIDPEKIVSAIVGKKKSEFSSIVENIPNIAPGTKAIIRPMWKTSFPNETSRIVVNINQNK